MSRLKKMQDDIKAVISTCDSQPNCPFQNFVAFDHALTFIYTDVDRGHRQSQFTLNLSEDYPEHTVVSCSDRPDESETTDDRVQVIFNQIAKSVQQEVRVPLQESPVTDGPASCHSENGPQLVEKMMSNSSHYSDCNSDITSDDYDDYYSEGEESEEDDLHMHPLLAQDMEMARALYGEKSLSHRLFGLIDDIDVELHIGMSFLDPEIAKAWKVIREEPIVVRLHLSLSRYLDATEPKVEVFQPSQKEKFGVGSQLRKILEQFISENWKDLTNDLVEAKGAKTIRPMKNSGLPPKKKFQTQMSNAFSWLVQKVKRTVPNLELSSWPADSGTSVDIDDHTLASILEMGFSAEMGRNALIITRGNLAEALNLLISSPDSLTGGSVLDGSSHLPSTAAMGAVARSDFKPAVPPPPAPPAPPPPQAGKHARAARQHSFPKAAKDKGRSKGTAGAGRQSGQLMAPDLIDLTLGSASPIDDLNLLPSSTQSGKNAKQIPGLENGFLVQVMQYTRQRLPTLNEYCVVCDEPHVFQNGAMLKPAVCARELCVFAFQTLGVMSDAAEDIATGAEVVDLLIAMAVAACRSHRKTIIFEPYPTVVDPTNTTELAFHPSKKDYTRVDKAMESFLQMQEMTSLFGSDLKKGMDQSDILAYPLLQWIITSNRSHIVKLPPEKRISFMHTPHQFLLMSSPPAKEAVFRAARKQYGSTFAFHGSHIENWHSIMRIGLINASGTKHQMHGDAYGKGIYLSPQASVSFGYSGMGYGHYKAQKGTKVEGKSSSRFLNSKNLTCIALCEVITHKDLRKSNNIWVMPHADFCCTRFFFVYEDGQVGDSNIDTREERYIQEIVKAVGYHT